MIMDLSITCAEASLVEPHRRWVQCLDPADDVSR